MASPPLFIAQVISFALIGLAGGLMGRSHVPSNIIGYLKIGLAGMGLTLMYAVLTTLSFVLFMGFSSQSFLAAFISGLGFSFFMMRTIKG